MRVVHVCPFVGEQMGGSERYVTNLSKTQGQKHDVHIFTTTRHQSRVGTSRFNGITLHRFHSPIVVWNINPIAAMLRSLVKMNADIYHIHSYLYTTSNQAILAKALNRKKSLLHIHGGIGTPPYNSPLVRRIVKLFYDRFPGRYTVKLSDALASVSMFDIEQISAAFDVPIEIVRHVPNAVDTNAFFPGRRTPDNETPKLLYVGDLELWKGIGSLLGWLKKPSGWQGIEFNMQFVGQGSFLPQLAELQEDFKKNGGPIQIEILGELNHEEIPTIMQQADAFVFPSYWEGMPTVVLEAMATGLPVISTSVGDVPSVIEDNETGLLIERSFDSFQEAVRIVLDSDDVINRIRVNSRNLVEEKFSLARVSGLVEGIYRDLI